ncbi:putative sulfate exporter family transporter [Paenarthrobacter sp. PH39-S1]|uniref:YeiH family protein n=1 Tax=Paenarthrobacter sp. PH39-S1 TaxID=3046204 RepID=UPI0024B9047F|nr:putative sulfate exporter family transporter [Paenarthrobacter sp. PH39-S1]MDJ0356729.1 putative sulfate exporter family transporter [Paenarthrobacter sp. PH39-S1]
MPSSAAAATVKRLAPGLVAALAAVGLALLVHVVLPSLPAMTVAVVLGILAANLPGSSTLVSGVLRPGLHFAGKHLMRAGIVLLGLKLSLGDVLALGWITAALVVAVVLLSFAGTYWLGKLFRLAGDAPLLIATGFSICGASAIGAMAAVKGTRHQETVLPVALVTLCGTLAIGVLPLLMNPLGLDPLGFGRWVGASVHDVGQVVATAQTAGTVALSAAIVIKLTRVLLLAPMVATAGVLERRAHNRRISTADRRASLPRNSNTTTGASRPAAAAALDADSAGPAPAVKFPPVVPLFVLGFLLTIALRTLGWVSPPGLELGNFLQDVTLGGALFGLGSSVRIRELLHTGLRASGMALCAWLLIAALGYGAVRLMAGFH